MSTIKADNFVDLSREVAGTTPNTIGSEYIIEGTAKAWVEGNTTAGRDADFNISSGTDNGVGDFSYGMSASMTGSSFAQTVAARSTAERQATNNNARITSSVAAALVTSSTAAADQLHSICVMGDLA